jgi:DNA-binding transcriptional ArsR family regulator
MMSHFRNCDIMNAPLRPTLWRSCRALANDLRLQLLALIIGRAGLTVSAAARIAGVRRPVASLSLRALEARGFLKVRRQGRWVQYSPVTQSDDGPKAPLAKAVTARLRRNPAARHAIYRLATAFTHPTRIEVIRALSQKHRTLVDLKRAVAVPGRTLLRHLKKLKARGFVQHTRARHRRLYELREPRDPLARTLITLATQE